MTIVETPWKWIYKFFVYLFGIPFSLIGVAFLIEDGSWAFMLNGALW